MQSIEMLNLKQFAAWKKIADDDIEFADEVLRYIHDIKFPKTVDECIQALIAEDMEFTGYGVAHPVYGTPRDAAKKILEIA